MEYFYRKYLKNELVRRIGINPRYSLRAFAKALQIDPSGLSKILANKRNLTFKAAEKLVLRLPIYQDAKNMFLISIIQEKKALSGLTEGEVEKFPSLF